MNKKLIISLVVAILLVNGVWFYKDYNRQHKESLARQQLNTAMQLWDSGQLVEADRLFKQIVADYAETAVATDAIEIHRIRLQDYRKNFEKQYVHQQNNAFSKQVAQQIEAYRQSKHSYPEELSILTIFQQTGNQGYLDSCIYEKALFDVSYTLNCQQADEKVAKDLMQKATKTWRKGDLATADALFRQIATEYAKTKTAKIAEEEHRAKIETYKQGVVQRNQLRSPRIGSITYKVRQQLEQFQQNTQNYPEQLDELGLFQDNNFKPYLKGCRYEKALFNAGYQLDCNSADEIFVTQKAHILSHPNIVVQAAASASSRSHKRREKVATKTMGNLFNPNKNAPESGFMAYYFNTENPEKIIFKEAVSDVAINYILDEFHDMHSENFGAYWAGEITVEQPTFKQLNVADGHLQARVLIDGKIVYDSKTHQNKPTIITFDAGKHFVEIELENHYHTTDFFVNFTDIITPMSAEQIRYYFYENQQDLGEFDVFYAGAYESDAQDLTVSLNILKNGRPMVLVLSSYRAIRWVINNPHKEDIKAIIYAGYEKGSTILDASPNTKLLPAEKRIGDYKLKAYCRCQEDGKLSCQSAISDEIKALTGRKLLGFAGDYNPLSLNIPTNVLDERFQRIAEVYDKKFSKQRQACLKKMSPTSDDLLKSPTKP